jgi:hypothetical protein
VHPRISSNYYIVPQIDAAQYFSIDKLSEQDNNHLKAGYTWLKTTGFFDGWEDC